MTSYIVACLLVMGALVSPDGPKNWYADEDEWRRGFRPESEVYREGWPVSERIAASDLVVAGTFQRLEGDVSISYPPNWDPAEIGWTDFYSVGRIKVDDVLFGDCGEELTMAYLSRSKYADGRARRVDSVSLIFEGEPYLLNFDDGQTGIWILAWNNTLRVMELAESLNYLPMDSLKSARGHAAVERERQVQNR